MCMKKKCNEDGVIRIKDRKASKKMLKIADQMSRLCLRKRSPSHSLEAD